LVVTERACNKKRAPGSRLIGGTISGCRGLSGNGLDVVRRTVLGWMARKADGATSGWWWK